MKDKKIIIKKDANKVFINLLYIILFNGCFFFCVMIYDYYYYYDLSSNAKITIGYVTKPVSDYIDYKYKVGNKWFYDSQSCYEKKRSEIEIGSSYVVLYSSENYKNSKLLYTKIDSLNTKNMKSSDFNIDFFEKPKGLIPWLLE